MVIFLFFQKNIYFIYFAVAGLNRGTCESSIFVAACKLVMAF